MSPGIAPTLDADDQDLWDGLVEDERRHFRPLATARA